MLACAGGHAEGARRGRPHGHTAGLAVGVLALYAVADTIKPSSREAVASLMALGITPVMLTGDNQATATAIAHEAGIGGAWQPAAGRQARRDQGAAGQARPDCNDR
jgi:cation transport ATPase